MTMSTSVKVGRKADELSLLRCVLVEARKLGNTRASHVLWIIAIGLSVASAGGRTLYPLPTTNLDSIILMAAMPLSFFLMVLVALATASEFSTGAGTTTFTLVPRREMIVGAKVVTSLVVGSLCMLFSTMVSVGFVGIAPMVSDQPVSWEITSSWMAATWGTIVFYALAGLAWSLLTRSAITPIVLLLAWPIVSKLIGYFSDSVANAVSYLDIEAVFSLANGVDQGWLKLASSAVVWIVLPLIAGIWRLRTSDLS